MRLLFQDSRTRIFFTSVRIDATHEATALGFRRVARLMRREDRIVWTTFWHADEEYFRDAGSFLADCPARSENIWVLGNTVEETRAAAAAGFRSAWVHNNCWLAEDSFRPLGLPKLFRAVMIAQAVDYKRPWLAARVPGLAFVETEQFPLAKGVDTSMLIRAERFSGLDVEDLARLINQSRVGLILSAVEGGSYVTSEYLACGIPVISTPSIGGRDVYLDNDNSLIVEPAEEAVAEGVERLGRNPGDPTAISARQARVSEQFRARFTREVVGTIFRETNNQTSPEVVLQHSLRHKMVDFVPEATAAATVLDRE